MIRSVKFYVNRRLLFIFYNVLVFSAFSFGQNAIVTENANAGNPISEWGVLDFRDNRIAGFANKMSLNRGETVRFKINVQSGANYTLRIYRIGYYGGNGARLMANLGTLNGAVQPPGVSDPSTGLLDCSNWSESATWAIPVSAVSGFYIAKIERTGGGSNHIAFIVRNDASNSDMYLQLPDATWQAYNGYGGNSMYDGNTSWPSGHAVKVSYNRPFFPYNSLFNTDGREADWYMNAEYPMIRWLERNGYDVTYTSCNDVARNGSRLLNHKVLILLGHDEYWSKAHRDNVEAARNAGVHLAFFTGNEVYWKTRWENNIGTEDRTLVCYKEGTLGDGSLGERTCGNKCDPSSEWTGLWRTGGNYDAGKPENGLLGQISWVEYPAEIGVPSNYKKLRFWRNSSVSNLSAGQTAFLGVNTLGYEWDYEQPQYASYNPPGRITMSSRTLNSLTHKLSLYRHSSGALVFGAGTVQWSWGLDGAHWGGNTTVSPEMQQATVNLFADMEVQAGSIQPGLTQTSLSTDHTAPTASITSPTNGATFSSGATITFSGNASDAGGGVVAAVEISVNGGTTWSPADFNSADASISWSYSWTATSDGTFNIKVRGVDDSGNIGNAGSGITITVGAGDVTPPTVSAVSPTNGATGVSVSTTISATFSEAINGATVTGSTFQLRNAGNNLVSATVSTSSNQITLIPTAALTTSTTYTVTIVGGASGVKDISGNALVNTYTWSFTTGSSGGGSGPFTVFQTTQTPSAPLINDGQGIEVGMRFRSTQNGFITGARYYKGAGTSGIHIGSLWNNAGTTRLAQANFTNETSSGWQQVLFSSPVAITAGVTYVVSYFSPSGDYAATKPYFTQAVINGPLIGLADGTDGANGVYRYSATSAFPNSSFQSSNYWVDVVFSPTSGSDVTPPAVTSVTPLSGATNVAVNTTVVANFSEAVNSASVTGTSFQLRNAANNLISGTLNTSGGQVTFTPSAALAGSTVYTVTISGGASGIKDLAGNALVNNFTWSFTTASVDNTPPTITSILPASGANGVNSNTTVIANFSEAIDGSTVTSSTFQLRNPVNSLVAATLSTSSNQVTLTPSASLAAGTNYTATIQNGFSGVKDMAGNALVNSFSWSFTTASVDNTSPTVSSVLPLNGATGVSVNTPVTASFNEAINAASVTSSTFQLRNAGGNLIGATVNAASNQITLTPTAALTASTTYTVTIIGGTSGVKDLAGNALVNNYNWSFTTAASGGGGTTYTVFLPANPPSVSLANDEAAIEMGMRFRSTQNGFITGVRYYKGAGTTGTHTGSLWNNAGTTRLAQATFTNETASGWQQVLFSSPVAITAGVSYVVSYFSPSGDYVATKPYFTQNVTNGPLIGLADGTDGANGLYRYTTTSAFPNSSFQSSNYWVDVVFSSGGAGGVAPTVTTHPASQSVCAGSNLSFNSSANGTPSPTVQWQMSTNGTSWSNITGATNGTLTFAATTGDNNKQYRAVWTNSISAVNSNPATLTVKAIPAAPGVTVLNNCGSSTLTATSFTGSLLWSNGATTSSITVTTAGTYTVTQTLNGCTSPSGSGVAAPLNSNVSAPGVSVVNNCGTSTLTAGSYTGSLLWSNGATSSSITVTTAGTYTVTQTVNGCTSPSGSGVAAPKAIPSAPGVTVVNNCGNSTLTATSFTGSLLWSNGATTSSITVTAAGTYSVTQIVNGCTSSSGSGVAAPKAIPSAPGVTVVNNCGNSILTATSFTGSLLWSNGATTSSITVTTGGTYTVTQTLNGCTSSSGSGVAAPLNSNVSAPTVSVVNTCGSSTLTAGTYTGSLLWSNGATTSSITVTTAGTYTVTQTVNGCTSPSRSGVASPKAIPSALNVTVVNNCGSSILSTSGYSGPLLWSTGAATSAITVTAAGTYTVTQTVNGCTSLPGSGVGAPKLIPSAPGVTVVNNCGSSTLTATSFTGSLLWSNGATTSSITVTTAGTYTVKQTVNGCISSSGSGVAAPANSNVSAPTVSVVNNCGTSTLTAGSFTGSLLWSNGATTSSITVATAGTYTVTQTVNGCTSPSRSGVAAPKAIPSAPGVTVVNNCGSSILTATSFTGSLLWSNGATTSSITVTTAGTYTVTQTVNGCTSSSGSGVAAPLNSNVPAPTVSVVNNCGTSTLTAGSYTGSLLWSNGATTSSITVTTAGTYTVTQTVNGCTSPSGSGLAAPKEIPSAPTVSVVNTCGSSTLTAGSFTGSLLWSNGATSSSITVAIAGTYTVTQTVNGCTSPSGSGVAAPKAIPSAPGVTVVNNCGSSTLTATSFTGSLLWSNGAITSSITETTAGTYTVTQTLNGCTSPSGSGVAAPLNSNVSAPGVTVLNNCGSSTLTATSFTGSLLWSNGATTSSITVTTAGTYTVTQTLNGCTSPSGSGVAAPLNSNVSAPGVSVVNNCGTSTLTAGSYTGSLLWSNGATSSSITVTTAGTYTVTQTVNGCTSPSGSGVAAPKAIPSAPGVTVVNNCGNSTLTATSFTGSLLWSNGATTSSITVTAAGTYSVTQIVNGCTSSSGSGVAAPKAIPSAPGVTVVNNCGNSILTATSFTGSLLWSNGATTSSITVTTGGTYTVTQTLNGCTSSSGSGVAAPLNSNVSAPTVSVVNTCGSSTLTAGTYTGSLLWSNGATTSSITVTTAGTYTVTQTVNGCTSPSRSGVASPKAIPSALNVTVVNNCGSSILSTSGYSGPLLWSTGAATSAITVTAAGTYTVTQTVNGCTSLPGSGVAAPKLIPSAPGVTVVNNCGSSTLTATSFTGSLLWSNGATTSSITVTTAGTYTVKQTVNGCISSSGSGVAAPANSNVSAPTVSVVNNCGTSTLTAGSFTGSLLWSNGATTSSITVATAGTYTVTQTVNGCTSPSRSGVAAPKAIPSAPGVTVVNNCGSSILTATSFTGSLLWSNGATTSSITVTTAGTYTVTQTVNGCTSSSGSGVAAPLNSNVSAPTVSVVNSCGSSTLTAGSFTGSLLWSNGATTSSITVTTPGTYTVTQTLNGCTSSSGSGVAAPLNSNVPAPTVSVVNNCGTSTLTAGSYTGSLLWSNGATTSSITVTTAGTYTVTQTVNGCTSPSGSGVAGPKEIPSAPIVSVVDNCGSSVLRAGSFTGSLLWSNGATTSPITVTTAGTYTVTQTLNGCTSPSGSGVAAPSNGNVSAPAVSVVNNCGSSTLTATSFTGSLLWSNGAITSSITVTTAGTYTVTQTLNGCTSSSGSGIAAPLNSNLPAPTVSVVNNCGTSTLTAGSYTGSLLWSNGATTSSITVATAGTYNVTQTVNGCTSPPGSGVAAPNEIPSAPTVSVVDNCGTSTLTAGSFTGSLLWSNGATTPSISVTTPGTYSVTQIVNGCTSTSGSGIAAPKAIPSAPGVTVVNNCGSSTLTATAFTGTLLWSNGATTSSITETIAGTYTVTQTVNGCASSSGSGIAAPLNSNIAAPTVSVVDNCGSSTLTAGSFTGSLLWSNGANTSSITVTTAGTYTVTQTVNGCTSPSGSGVAAPKEIPSAPIVSVVDNCGSSTLTASSFTGSLLWSNGATTSSIGPAIAGTYTVTQTVNGCTSPSGSGVAAPKEIPSAPIVSVVDNCGSSTLTASSFTGSLLWSNGATTSSIGSAIAGTYTVTQTVNGCTSPSGSGVAAPKEIPSAPTVSVLDNCGSSVLTAGSFTGSLLWSNGATTSSITVTTAGTYTVTQTVNECTSSSGSGVASPITLSVPAPSVSVVDNCGSSILTADSFTGTLLWSNGATTSSIAVTTPGTYTVTQTVNGCTSPSGTGVAAPKEIPPAPVVSVVDNCGSSTLTASSFTGSLLWSNGATTSLITETIAGTYTVTQTLNGCASSSGSGIAAPKEIPSAPTVSVLDNCGSSVLTAGLFTGSLLWSNGSTTGAITVAAPGTYTVIQTVDACNSPSGNGVAAPKSIPALTSNLTATIATGTAFAYIPTSTETGTTFTWSRSAVTGIGNAGTSGNGDINETLNNTSTSPVSVTYVYTLTANGCTNTQNVVVTVNPVASGVNCVINSSITQNFNSTEIPAGRFIWFNSSFNPGNLGLGIDPVTITVTNTMVTFTANSVLYTLNVPDARIRFNVLTLSASTQFVNNVWETEVPRTFTDYIFMNGLSYLVPVDFPGNISNVVWTANISIDKTDISLVRRWSAAVYTNFAANAGVDVKPIKSSLLNPYLNFDDAGTPENFKSFVVSGAKGSGETDYTGTFTTSQTSTCAEPPVGTRGINSSITTMNVATRETFNISKPLDKQLWDGKLHVQALPNPSASYFNVVIKGNQVSPVTVRVLDMFGRVVEKYEKIASTTVLKLGYKLISGSYFVEGHTRR